MLTTLLKRLKRGFLPELRSGPQLPWREVSEICYLPLEAAGGGDGAQTGGNARLRDREWNSHKWALWEKGPNEEDCLVFC